MTLTVIPPVGILKVVTPAVKVWASRVRACAVLLEMAPVLAETFGAKTKVKRRKATASVDRAGPKATACVICVVGNPYGWFRSHNQPA